MSDRMSEHMPERMYDYISHIHFHNLPHGISGWGSLEVKYSVFSVLELQPIGTHNGLDKPVVLLYIFHVICYVENWIDQLKMKSFCLP